MKLRTFFSVIPIYAILIGLMVSFAYPYYTVNNTKASVDTSIQLDLSVVRPLPITEDHPLMGQPISLSIPSVEVNVSVNDGTYNYDTHEWSISQDHASFATVSIIPNTLAGSTIIYAHNSKHLFAPTFLIKEGNKAYIRTDNHLIFEYEFVRFERVSPNDPSVLMAHDKPQLVLITCEGTWNSHRRLMYFSFISVNEATI